MRSFRLQHRHGLKLQLSFSRIMSCECQVFDTKHAPSQCSTTQQSALPCVRVCCRRASTAVVPQAKHSTVQRDQHSTKQQIKYVPIRARHCKQADRFGDSQHVVELFYSIIVEACFSFFLLFWAFFIPVYSSSRSIHECVVV